MANTQAICSTFKRDILNGLHAFGTSVIRAATTKDVFKGALYYASATINAATTAYTVTGEVSSAGYTAGGATITNATEPSLSGATAIWTPSAVITWSGVTIAAFDAILIYNDTATGKNSVAVYSFGSQSIVSGNFTLTMPANDASNALLRLA